MVKLQVPDAAVIPAKSLPAASFTKPDEIATDIAVDTGSASAMFTLKVSLLVEREKAFRSVSFDRSKVL